MSPDLLSPVLAHFSVRARVFYTGNLCGHAAFDESENMGFLHLLRSGKVNLHDRSGFAETLSEPTLVFYSRPLTHALDADPAIGADLACASVDFENRAFNPIALALPPRFQCALRELDQSQALLELLFAEAFAARPGRQEVLNRLFELVLIDLLRAMLARGDPTRVGFLRGLAHPQLGKTLTAIHADPARDWSLEAMAAIAAMSRSSFASTFRREVGQTPGDYLAGWRISTAQTLLRHGVALKHVADRVGYGSQAGFLRAFRASLGLSPTEWLRQTDAAARAVSDK
jgi:AraC-like DNA-binding protein